MTTTRQTKTLEWGDAPNHPRIRVSEPMTERDSARLWKLYQSLPKRSRPSRLAFLVRGYRAEG